VTEDMSKDPPPATAPMEILAPGNYDRAWNDPPLFSYSSSSTSQPGGGNRLTKRVGFPASNNLPTTGQDPTAPPSLSDAGAKPPPCIMPPPPCMLPPPPSSSIPPSLPPSSSHPMGSTEAPSLSSEQLEELLGKLTKEYFGEDKAAELDKRLSHLVTSHRNNTLGTRIPGLVGKLVESLRDGNIQDTQSSFTTLSADHGGESGNAQWMIALRHLVTKVQEKHCKEEKEAITAPL